MVEVLSLIPHPPRIPNTTKRKFFTRFRDLLCYLFKKSSGETDANHPIVVIIPHGSDSKKPPTTSRLDSLCFDDKLLLLRYYFGHLNLLVCNETITAKHMEEHIEQVAQLMTNRISRVETWTGTGKHPINDKYNSTHINIEHESSHHHHNNSLNNKHHSHNNSESEFHPPKVSGIIPTMTYILNNNSTKGEATIETLTFFKDLILEEVDFLSLLDKSDPEHLNKLCFSVGNWSFPAHELTNDDLVYCAYLMLNYALKQLDPSADKDLHIPDQNELLALIFMVRDTYKNGNPFHNFRHAVDVVQACFHFLVRLGCLPEFKQLNLDPESESNNSSEEIYLELCQTERHLKVISSESDHLNSLQTLGLLTAALGHDVGHPGVTNAFMIKNSAPTSLIFNDRSVLESYHSSVFINKILAVNWNSLLSAKTDCDSGLTVRELIISSILATDMGEHFEYINKLRNLKSHDECINYNNKVKLISSLLIKCADISNVTRPLRVSAQWAMVLAREFEEVAILDSKLNDGKEIDLDKDISYDLIPHDLVNVLSENPNLHKGQIFFINTFAENLFNSVAELLPEMKYACDIIQENKAFWLVRDEQIG